MADRYWLGVNTNLTDTANWSATRLGAGAASVPGVGDVAYLYDGSRDIDTNITNFLATTTIIGGEFRGNIGTATQALEFGTAGATVTIEAVSKDYISVSAKAATTIATLNIKATGRYGGIVNIGGTGTFTNVYCGSMGRASVDSAAVVTNLYSAGINVSARAGTAFTILQLAGQPLTAHVIGRGFTTGTFAQTAVLYNGTAAITTINVFPGASYTHQSDQTITTANVMPNGIAMAGSLRFTVSNLNQWGGSQAFEARDRVTVTSSVYIGDASFNPAA